MTRPRSTSAVALLLALLGLPGPGGAQAGPAPGSAIFLHPDGAAVSHWSAARLLLAGPDGEIHWDRLPAVGVYRGHLSNSVASSSHGGATAHAYGVKVLHDSFGMDGTDTLTALSGFRGSLMAEARESGIHTGLVNSGHLAEPGTAVWAASAPSRADVDAITLQLVESGTRVILGGGEVLLLPAGEVGRHGQPGLRQDGRNLLERAAELGYTIVYDRDALLALPDTVERVLGVFAAGNTFNDRSEEDLRTLDLPPYAPDAPTLEEMTEVALRILSAPGGRFFLVVEEEGSDNLANQNNAPGTMEALARADAALGVALDFVDRNPETLLLTAADSDAGGLAVHAVRDSSAFEQPLPPTMGNGAPLDGREGTASPPFVAAADRAGIRLRFGIAWSGFADMMAGIVARAAGLNAELLPTSVDNTDVYRMLYGTLFGRWPER